MNIYHIYYFDAHHNLSHKDTCETDITDCDLMFGYIVAHTILPDDDCFLICKSDGSPIVSFHLNNNCANYYKALL